MYKFVPVPLAFHFLPSQNDAVKQTEQKVHYISSYVTKQSLSVDRQASGEIACAKLAVSSFSGEPVATRMDEMKHNTYVFMNVCGWLLGNKEKRSVSVSQS